MSNLFEALFVVIGAHLLASVRSFSFNVVLYLLSGPLGVDVETPK